jgi:hypothetical protein
MGVGWMLVSKNGLFEPFIFKNEHFTKTLGTNIGKTQKKDRFSSGGGISPWWP